MEGEIRAWLNGSKAYDAGASLYRKYGNHGSVLHEIQGEETPFRKKLLFDALRELITSQSTPPIPRPGAPLVTTPVELFNNEAVTTAKRDADRLYKEMANIRAELLALCQVEESPRDTDPDEKKKRGALAREIIRLEYLVEEAYADYRYTQVHGVRKNNPPPVEEEVDAVDLHQKISNVRKYLSKLRKDPEKNAAKITDKESLLNNYLKLYEQAKASGPVVA